MTVQRPALSLSGALVGAAWEVALAVLATFLGEVRATPAVLLLLIGLGTLAGALTVLRRVLGVLGGVLLAALSLCLLTPVLRAPLSALEVRQTPVPADAIVILGGGVQCGTAALEASSLTRLTQGLTLWRAGYAPRVTVSEQSGLIGPRDCPKMSDIERRIIAGLYAHSGPEVLTLRRVTTTRDEAARVRDLARAGGWRRVLLVTTPSHSRRAQAIFRAQGVDAVSVPAPEIRFDETLNTPLDRLWALRVLSYEGLSRLKAAVGGTPER